MKCPECDTEQPDDTAICAGCGLDFKMWVDMSDSPSTVKPAPEDLPLEAPAQEPASSPFETSETGEASAPLETEPSRDAAVTENLAVLPPKKSSFQRTLLIISLLALLGLAAFYLIHKKHPLSFNPVPMGALPAVVPSVSSTMVPAAGTPTASATSTPEKTPTATPVIKAVIPVKKHDVTMPVSEKPMGAAAAVQETPAVKTIPAESTLPASTPETQSKQNDSSPAASPQAVVPTPTSAPADLLESIEPLKPSPTATP